MKPDYGIDAPGVRRGMLIAGALGALGVVFAVAAAWGIVGALAGLVAAYGFGMAGYMTYDSRVGKARTREKLLDLVEWRGSEDVLDVGCGRGLMLVGAAKRLAGGKAVGVDIWRAEDQADNRPEAALENARLEGVEERIRIETGDARKLPFPDASFDVVLSRWVVHNLPAEADRTRALDEMIRVLRPGGVLVLADIANHARYREQLAARAWTDRCLEIGGVGAAILGILSGGSFRPRAIVWAKTR